MSTAPLPVWLDCDPGHDDALAIILAAYTPGIRLLGLSTVHGNQTLAKTSLNARRVLAMAGVEGVRVAPGAAKPLLRPPRVCAEIHGASGLDGPDLTAHDAPHEPSPRDEQPAVVQMHAALRAAGERATLVCTGALTNAALLLSVYPELAATTRVVFMGGAVHGGNTGAVAEFNMQLDPEAAAVVLASGAHVTMVPLEVTHTALVTPDVLRRIRDGPSGAGSRFRRVVGELLVFFAGSYKAVFGFDAPPLHDPCAVLCALAPQLFELRHMRVDVETASPLSYGQTVCDVRAQSAQPPNVHVALRMDVPAFWAHMHAALDAADARSPMNVVSSSAS